MNQISMADYKSALAQIKMGMVGYTPLVYAIHAMRKICPAVEQEIKRINHRDNLNIDLYPVVTEFVKQTFPELRLPTGEDVLLNRESIKQVISSVFTLIC